MDDKTMLTANDYTEKAAKDVLERMSLATENDPRDVEETQTPWEGEDGNS